MTKCEIKVFDEKKDDFCKKLELDAPKMVFSAVRFTDSLQAEYIRQMYFKLFSAVNSAKKSLEKLKENAASIESIEAARLKVAKSEVTFKNFKNFLKNSEVEAIPLPTGNRIAAAYIWALFNTSKTFNVSNWHSCYVDVIKYARLSSDEETPSDDSKKALKTLKKEIAACMGAIFNTTAGEGCRYTLSMSKDCGMDKKEWEKLPESEFKNSTVPAEASTWIVKNVSRFAWGKLQSGKKATLQRKHAPEMEVLRQCILSYFQFYGIELEKNENNSFVDIETIIL